MSALSDYLKLYRRAVRCKTMKAMVRNHKAASELWNKLSETDKGYADLSVRLIIIDLLKSRQA